jgi:hypothetical protein
MVVESSKQINQSLRLAASNDPKRYPIISASRLLSHAPDSTVSPRYYTASHTAVDLQAQCSVSNLQCLLTGTLDRDVNCDAEKMVIMMNSASQRGVVQPQYTRSGSNRDVTTERGAKNQEQYKRVQIHAQEIKNMKLTQVLFVFLVLVLYSWRSSSSEPGAVC